MAILLVVAGTAIVQVVVGALVAEFFKMVEKYSCRCNQCKCCCCWRLLDVGVGADGRYVTINVMLTCCR